MRWIFFALAVLAVAADWYTTKRALLDAPLRLREKNRIVQWVWRKLGIPPGKEAAHQARAIWAFAVLDVPVLAFLAWAMAQAPDTLVAAACAIVFVRRGMVAWQNRDLIIRKRRKLASRLPGVILVLSLAGVTHAGTVSIAWDPVPDTDVAGYRVFWGAATATYSDQVDVGNVTATTITVGDCQDWFVAVKAYDAAGNQSLEYSNEVVGWARPVVSTLQPSVVERGWRTSVLISGSNFKPGSSVLIDWPGVVVENVSITACDRLTVDVVVANNAPEGLATVEVIQPDQVFGAKVSGLEISRDKTPPGRVPNHRREGDRR